MMSRIIGSIMYCFNVLRELRVFYNQISKEKPRRVDQEHQDTGLNPLADKKIPRKIDLGCGNGKQEGFYGVDIVNTEETDQVVDLEEENWDLPSNYFEHVRTDNVAEHIENFDNFMAEIHRITEPGGTVELIVPHYLSRGAQFPGHVNYFSEHSTTSAVDRPDLVKSGVLE